MQNSELVGDVVSLHIYPIKGCRAIDVESLRATARGFPFDRNWVIVRERNMRYITQRNLIQLPEIAPEIPQEALNGSMLTPEMCLTIRFPHHATAIERIEIPLLKTDQPVRMITVCDWTGYALDEGDVAAHRLSSFLQEDVRLFRFISNERPNAGLPQEKITRSVNTTFAYGYTTTFTDGFPYLIINKTSYEDLRHRAQADFAINRFRPNIVVQGMNAWEEDDWRKIRILSREDFRKGPLFRLVKPCQRCVVTCIDQMTGRPGIQPLEALKRLRSGEKTGFSKHLTGTEKQGFFGWNAVCDNEKVISVGDCVSLETQGKWVPGLTLIEYANYSWNWLRQQF